MEKFSVSAALEYIQESSEDAGELRRRAADLRAGMDIFNIP